MASMFDRLKKAFGITTKKVDDKSSEKILYPAEYDKEVKKLVAAQFTDELDRLYKLWLTDALDSSKTLRDRIGRIEELSYAYYNSPIISIATRLYADETLSADEQDQVLKIYAKNPKLETYIHEFFDKIGVTTSVLKSLAHDLSLYGDHFWVLTVDDSGISRITPIDITAIKDRIEFNAIQVAKSDTAKKYKGMLSRQSRMEVLTKIFDKETAGNDPSKYFQTYLFGYQIEEDIFLPPWNVSHFRILSHNSEFYPYGRPILINCLSPFKQLQTAKNLMAIARANNFPLKLFKVKTADSMSPIDQWQVVSDAREQYENLMGISNKEQFSVNGAIWAPQELLEIESVDFNYDMDKIADVEMLKLDLADGTGIPADYLSSAASSWGKSGQSLLQQSKLFARGVYTIQSAITDELVNIIKLQLIMTGDFPEDEEFEISLNFPVPEEDADKMRQKGDSVDLAKNIIDNLAEVMGMSDEGLPLDIVKDILNKMSFFSSEDINKYIKSVEARKKEIEKENEANEGEEDEDMGFDESYHRREKEATLREKIEKRLSENLIREVYFTTKKRMGIYEGVNNMRHYSTSFKPVEHQKRVVYEALKNMKFTTNKLEEEV